MHADQGKRFQNSSSSSPKKKSEGILTYESFSEYLRQQFLQSRNLFQHYQNYRKTQKHKKGDHKSVHPEKVANPPTAPETDDGPEAKNEGFFLTQTDEVGIDMGDTITQQPPQQKKQHEQQPKLKLKKKKNGKSLVLLKSKVLPAYLDNTEPGPGSYHKQDTLIKESFNRVYSEPPDAFAGLKHSATGKALQSYRRSTTSHQKKENKPLWNRTKNPKSHPKPETFRTSKSASALKSSRSFEETGGFSTLGKLSFRNPYTTMASTSHPNSANRKKKQNEIYGKRYPPISEKIIRRWNAFSHDSYPDYSKPSLVGPHHRQKL